VVWDIPIVVEVRDIPPTPCAGHDEDQEANVLEMLSMKSRAQAVKNLVKGGRNTYDPEHGSHASQPRVKGSDLHSLAAGGTLPPRPQIVKHQPSPT
jgi:hypothetical protein